MGRARAAAVGYRRDGWCPIPIKEASKQTALARLAPYLDRPATDEEIRSWSWPGVGIVTGHLSGVLVLDVDGPAGEAELQKHGHPVTPMARTPGGGLHLYFKHPEQHVRTGIRVGPGLDVKAAGGYVVAPPSTGPNGRPYEWIVSTEDAELADPPDWLMHLIEPQQRKAPAAPKGDPMRSAPTEAYHDNQPSLVPEVRDLLALHRDRAMSPSELAARLHQEDEYAVLAALEALEVESEVLA